MAQTHTRPSLSRLEVLAGVVFVFGLFSAVLFAFDNEAFLELGAIAAAAGFVTGGRLLVRYAQHTENDDAASFFSVGVGVQIAGVWMVVTGALSEIVDLPAFGLHDLPFIVAYGLFLNALARFPSANFGWRSQVRIVLDALVGAVSVATILWLTTRDALAMRLEGLTPIETVLGISYPILDAAVIVGAMVVILRRGRYRFDMRVFALATGFALQSAADLDFLTSSPTGLLTDARPNMVLFIGAAGALIVTGLLVGRAPAPVEVADRPPPLWSFAIPYSLGIAIVVFHMVQAVNAGGHTDAVLDVGSFLVLLLVIARQALAIQDNRTKVERERRSLIASVSHELRTPLTSMIGFLTVMQEAGDELPPEERAELSQVVLDQANYMGRMVTDIVLLARDTPEKMTLADSEIPVRALLMSILDTLGHAAGSVDTRIDPDLVVAVDVDRMRQLVLNLLENALRYGASRCELHLFAEGASLAIEVHDDGPGVSPKFQQTIWERFERGPNQLNSNVPGTGLGLAIVDMIAKAHGGTAAYRDSEVLGGACFSVTLPGRVISRPAPDEDVAPIRPSSRPASVRSL